MRVTGLLFSFIYYHGPRAIGVVIHLCGVSLDFVIPVLKLCVMALVNRQWVGFVIGIIKGSGATVDSGVVWW